MAETTPKKPKNTEGDVVYTSRLVQVRELDVGKPYPYVFVDRIGAVTILPIIEDKTGAPMALTIDNKRDHYGMSERSLPSGNLKGGFEEPEPAVGAAIRELGEETGYAPLDPEHPNIEVFALPWSSTTVNYPRVLAVMRNLIYQPGLKEKGGSEEITPNPTPVETYVKGLVLADKRMTYPEVHLAFYVADRHLGRDAVTGWLVGDTTVPGASDVPEMFAEWLPPLPELGRPPA